MKKNKIHSTLIFLLVFASLACYTFLNTVDIPVVPSKEKTTIYQEAPSVEEDAEIVLPDVQLLKKVLEKSRGILPAS